MDAADVYNCLHLNMTGTYWDHTMALGGWGLMGDGILPHVFVLSQDQALFLLLKAAPFLELAVTRLMVGS